jgi:hypothetical protein
MTPFTLMGQITASRDCVLQSHCSEQDRLWIVCDHYSFIWTPWNCDTLFALIVDGHLPVFDYHVGGKQSLHLMWIVDQKPIKKWIDDSELRCQ